MRIPERLCIFEDDQYADLYPLVYMRPVFDLRCGALTLRQRIIKYFPESTLHLRCRDHIQPLVFEQNPGVPVNVPMQAQCLFINAAAVMDDELFRIITSGDGTFRCQGKTLAFWNSPTTENTEVNTRFIRYPWDIVQHNTALLKEDAKYFSAYKSPAERYGVWMVNSEQIMASASAVIKPGVVLDAERGPVIIDNGATVMSNSVIEGPCYIGENTVIKAGAKIYGGTVIGPTCKIGGEVEGSVFLGFSNKQHDGFVGHSVIAEWCNLGADTNTSDLKNNYSNVRVTIGGREVDTGSLFVGLTMGDHSKCGINTMFNTGTVAGVSANIFGGGFPPKFIPSFSWVNVPAREEYQLDKAVEVARIVMTRRHVAMSHTYEELFRYTFRLTEKERHIRCG